MPLLAPETLAAMIAIPVPLVSLDALIPSPASPVTEPLTSIEIEPPLVLCAIIPLSLPVMSWPSINCTRTMSAAPGCVRLKASSYATVTGVSESSVTLRSVLPLAPRFCGSLIRPVPLQVKMPLPSTVSRQSLMPDRNR